jgi:pimeloyl-ACP methyl ester carboxylesterase
MPESADHPAFAAKPDGATIAYRRIPGKNPGVVFLGGFKSDMTGTKATALEAYCQDRGRAFLRFDYRGHGASSGAFEDGCIGDWADDARFAITQLTEGPQVLVGSSMGGWIMLMTAAALPEHVAALVGIAAAPDFTEDLIATGFTAEDHAALDRDGHIDMPSDYEDGEAVRITKKLITDGRHHLLLREPLEVSAPMRLLQGMEDKEVPFETALRIAEVATGSNIVVHLVKDGDHRLSRDSDLKRLFGVLDDLFETVDG